MSKPNLIIIAGCNGSGKSTYSKSLVPSNVIHFDADKRKSEIYDSIKFEFEFREKMAWNKTQEELEKVIKTSIKSKKDFAYETNFNHTPLHWVKKFKEAGYAIHLLFFSLKNIKLAKERVAIRFQNGGRYVPDVEVELRYSAGFNNLDKHYTEFARL